MSRTFVLLLILSLFAGCNGVLKTYKVEITTQEFDPNDPYKYTDWNELPIDTTITFLQLNDEDACIILYYYFYVKHITIELSKFYELTYTGIKLRLYNPEGKEILPTLDFPRKKERMKLMWEQAKKTVLEGSDFSEKNIIFIKEMEQPVFFFE